MLDGGGFCISKVSFMRTHSLLHSLVNINGNAKGCVYPRPLNAIPVNLYALYISVFMLALGVRIPFVVR